MSKQYELKSKTFTIGALAINSDAIKTILWRLNHAIRIDSVYFGADTACAAADTNYNTISLTDITNVIAAIANGPAATGSTFAAGVPLVATTTPVAAYCELEAGDVLQIECVKTGNGLALAGFFVQINYYDIST